MAWIDVCMLRCICMYVCTCVYMHQTLSISWQSEQPSVSQSRKLQIIKCVVFLHSYMWPLTSLITLYKEHIRSAERTKDRIKGFPIFWSPEHPPPSKQSIVGFKQQIHTHTHTHTHKQERQKHQAILDVIMSWKLAYLNRQHITNIIGHLVPHLHKLPNNVALSAPFSSASL